MKESSDRPVVVVVGAYGGLGAAVARRLHSKNARLCLIGRDEDKVAAVADQYDASYMVADANVFSEMKECIEAFKDSYGRIDGVVSAVGSLLIKPSHLTSESEWNSVLANNLSSAFSVLRSSSKAMMGHGGSIVLVSSVAAQVGLPNHDALAAAKAGVEGLVRSAAASYAKHGIRVNSVSPGIMDTPLSAPVTRNKSMLDAVLGSYPIPRLGSPDEVAVVIDWLLDEDSSWVTGQIISVDGGFSALRGSAHSRASNNGNTLAPGSVLEASKA